MRTPAHRVVRFSDSYVLSEFACGEPEYDAWLQQHARQAVSSRSSMVYLLVDGEDHVLGYYAICPTLVARSDLPKAVGRGLLNATPGWLLTKLALHQELRSNENQWGRQLLRDALERIVQACDLGGGQVVVVEAGHPGLVPWYRSQGFAATGVDDVRLYLKIATARRYLSDL